MECDSFLKPDGIFCGTWVYLLHRRRKLVCRELVCRESIWIFESEASCLFKAAFLQRVFGQFHSHSWSNDADLGWVETRHHPRYLYWLVLWNMNFMTFHILGISSSQLTNSIIFQRGWNHQPEYTYICFPYHVPFNSLDILDIFILYFALVSWGSWRIFQLASCKRWQFANWKNIPCLRTVSQLYIDMNRPFSSSQTVTNYQTVYQNYTVLAAAI